MIPKIIHFTWFSDDPYPQKIMDCIQTWKKFMPEYEFVHWNYDKIKDIDNEFMKEALKRKKWAFAADFVRLYALFNYGGIYLDTDVKVYKSYNDLLNSCGFIGMENSIHIDGQNTERYLTSHCMGATKGNVFIGKCLEYYNKRHFILSEEEWLPEKLKYDMTLLPYIQSEIAKLFGYNPSPKIKNSQMLIFNDEPIMSIFPQGYFDAIKLDKNTFCKHLAVGSWRPSKRKDVKINLKYKINWRIKAIFEKLLKAFGYLMIKIN